VIVTSLSPNPSREHRQIHCLQSWRTIGFEILAVNTAEEHDGFTESIRSLITPVVSDNLTTDFVDRQTQRVTALIDAGEKTGLPFMLINSDIEIHGDHELIEAALRTPDRLTIGIRHNHDAGALRDISTREEYGLDAFIISPKIASKIPRDVRYGIGKPVWDYWLPHHCRMMGHAINWIYRPLFFHERHDQQWTKEEWDIAGKWITEGYGFDPDEDFVRFRQELALSH
jgi:hypothetical protein